MSAKDYLNQIQSNKERIRQLKIIKEHIHINYTGISAIDYSGDKVQSTPHDVMFDKGCELLEDIEKIDKEIRQRVEANTKIALEIQYLNGDDYKYSTILFERYYVGKSLADISKSMYLDYKYVCQLHGEALRQFAQQYLTNTTNHD
jgi:hypothetical protein